MMPAETCAIIIILIRTIPISMTSVRGERPSSERPKMSTLLPKTTHDQNKDYILGRCHHVIVFSRSHALPCKGNGRCNPLMAVLTNPHYRKQRCCHDNGTKGIDSRWISTLEMENSRLKAAGAI